MVNINIPLPTSCASCPLSVRHFGKLYCPPLNDRVGNEGKDARCPLVDAGDRGDMISRADALSCFHDWIDQRGDVHTADEMPEYQRIEQLQSAQPEPEEFEWCTDCKEYDQTAHCCHRWTKVIRQTVEELQAQPKTGKWIEHNPHKFGLGIVFECSECGEKIECEEYNYCPECGCRMLKEGEQE